MNRKEFLSLSALTLMAQAFGEDKKNHKFKIGVCDWSAGCNQNPAIFKLSKELGLDGAQIAFVPGTKKFDLTKAETQKHYLAEAKKNNVEIASLAMPAFNYRPFSSHKDAVTWVQQSFKILQALEQKIVMLAFFGKGDIKKKPDLQKEVIKRLKILAPQAEKAGYVIGLETWMDKDEHMKIIDAVGSKAVKVYYDTANMHRMGYDICKEIKWLIAKDAVCQIHTKERKDLLGKGVVDFLKFRDALKETSYKGWLVIENGVKGNMKTSHKANGLYLNKIFNK